MGGCTFPRISKPFLSRPSRCGKAWRSRRCARSCSSAGSGMRSRGSSSAACSTSALSTSPKRASSPSARWGRGATWRSCSTGRPFPSKTLASRCCASCWTISRRSGSASSPSSSPPQVPSLVSTTGDTGPAAIRACASLPSLRIVCCYPLGQLSRFQEMQMTTVEGTNVNVFAFEGGGDDMDAPIKALSTDAAFQEKYHVASVNSINLARILAQTVHFFFSYFRAIEHAGLEVGAKVCLAVPCGALGNIVAALIAKRLGLPLGVIVCGTNANDIFHRAVADGDFTRHPTMHRTLSEAINIQVPYNFERVIALLADDAPLIKSMMEELTRDNKMAIPPALLASLRDTFRTTPVDDDALLAEIRARSNPNP
ncbi:tryptophan synthase beta subunit-like PLP-dependent enzyme [Baffinella frigidus]|nr:tryptophan synthase beta subunit-like PLP-dependent enzyme [Cryptophyta sp. CCMP2293]